MSKDSRMTVFPARERSPSARATFYQKMFRKYFQVTNEIAVALDREGRVTFINRRGCQILGVKEKDAIGKNWFRHFVPKRLQASVENTFRKLIAGKIKTVKYFSNPVRAARGEEKIIHWHNVFLKNKQGKIEGTLSSGEDITRKHDDEKALQLAEFSLKYALDPVYWTDDKGFFTYINQAACNMLGYTRKEFLEMSVMAIDPDYPVRRWAEFRRKIRKQKNLTFETRHKAKNGKLFNVEMKVIALNFEGKEYYCAFVRDITEHKKAEEEVARSISLRRATLESTADGILVVNRSGQVSDFNRQFLRLWRIPKKLLGCRDDKKLLEFVLNQLKDPKAFLKKVNFLYAHPRKASFDIFKFKDGRVFERYSQPQEIANHVVGRVWSFRDVTRRKEAEDALRSSEERYRKLFESSHDAMMTLEPPSWRFTSANHSMVKMFKAKNAAELFRHSPWALSPRRQPDGRSSVEKAGEMIRTAMRRGSHFFEWTHRRLSGESFPVEVLLTKVEKGQGFLQATVRDITERKRIEDELKETKERLETILAVTKTGVDVIDANFNLRYVDPGWQKIYGNFRGCKCYKYFMGREKVCPGCGIPRALRTRKVTITEEVLPREGNRRIEVHTIPFKNAQGEWLVAEFNVDITERKKAEEAIVEGRRQLRQIIDAVPHMIFAKDSKGCFLLVNEAVGRMYGKKPASLVGLRLQDVHSVAAEARQFLTAEKEVLKSGNPVFRPDEVFTDKCGKEYILETIRLPFKMAGRTDPVILGVSKDVTQQRKIEKFRGEIIGTVSHEFRTPLSIEKEGVKLLLDEVSGQINPDQRTILEAVMRGIDRLAGMVDKMLDISRIEAGKMAFKKKVCDLTGVVRNVMAGYKVMARGREALRLEENLPDREVKVFADPDRIGEVLGNLLDNSLKFTRRGTISVTLKVLGKKVRCEVRDTGVGMSPEQVRIMFEKFRQFSRIAGPGPKGLGLGLPIAREIIQKHHGRIWAESKLGKGTRVMFVLPLYARKGVRK